MFITFCTFPAASDMAPEMSNTSLYHNDSDSESAEFQEQDQQMRKRLHLMHALHCVSAWCHIKLKVFS